LVDNNATIASEISKITAELLKSQETSQRIADSFDKLQAEYATMRDTLNHNLLDVSRITSELLAQTRHCATLKEEVVRHQLVNQQLKETFSAENDNIRQSFEKEKSMILESQEKEKLMIRESLEKEKSTIRESLEKENRIIKEILDKKSDRITMYARERLALQEKIDHLRSINLDLERRQAQTYDSLTWKVGAVLVKKPADAVVSIKRMLSPRKKAR
jgi:chromosome segregation ATPase